MRLIGLLLCKLGMHGPQWLGNESQCRSARVAPMLRQCYHCKTIWIGREIETRNMRTLGGWTKAKSPEDLSWANKYISDREASRNG